MPMVRDQAFPLRAGVELEDTHEEKGSQETDQEQGSLKLITKLLIGIIVVALLVVLVWFVF